MDTRSQLLRDIEAFVAERGMAESTFGRQAVNDGKFVSRLRRRANMTLDVVERAQEYIRAQRSSEVQSQGGEAV